MDFQNINENEINKKSIFSWLLKFYNYYKEFTEQKEGEDLVIFFKKILFLIGFSILFNSSVWAFTTDHCKPYEHRPDITDIFKQLASKLSYDYYDLCHHPRIMAIFPEERRVYIQSKDRYDDHIFVTLHYSENSCEYQYNLVEKTWGHQHCYNTW